MTDNTMREGKLWAFLHDSLHEAYNKLSTTGTSNEYHALLDSIAAKVADDVDARFLQAAQSEQSVPVVGEVTLPLAQLAYERAFGESEDIDFCLRIARNVAALIQPAHSITTAELERLRRMETSHYWLTVGDDQKPQVLDAAIAGEKK